MLNLGHQRQSRRRFFVFLGEIVVSRVFGPEVIVGGAIKY